MTHDHELSDAFDRLHGHIDDAEWAADDGDQKQATKELAKASIEIQTIYRIFAARVAY